MSTVPPTTTAIANNIIAQLQLTLNQTIPLLPKAFTRVLARAIAGVFTLLYKYGGFTLLQIFVRSASNRETEVNGLQVIPLQEWGRLVGVDDQRPATQAELTVTVTVRNQTGSLPAGSQLVSAESGVVFLTLADVALNAATVTALVRASNDQTQTEGAGEQGNQDVGSTLTFANPLPNVERVATVTALDAAGEEGETEAEYRQRVIDRFQKRPQGGAYADYELWAKDVAGIINVYPYTSVACPGQVEVYVEATEASSGSADGIPTVAQLAAVLASIQKDVDGLASRRPATSLVNVFPIVRKEFTVQVLGLSAANASIVQADVTAAVQEHFLSRGPFIDGLTPSPRRDRISRSTVASVVDEVVASAGGVVANALLFDDMSSVTDLYTLGDGEKAKAVVSFV